MQQKRGSFRTAIVFLCASSCASPALAGLGDLLRTVHNPQPNIQDQFGSAFAVAGRRLIVGSRNESVHAVEDGAAFVVAGKTGQILSRIDNPFPDSLDSFGLTIAAEGYDTAIGTWRDDTSGVQDAGAAYLFDHRTGLLKKLLWNPDPQSDDRFGWGIAIGPQRVAVSAYKDDSLAQDGGAVYLYDRASGGLTAALYDPTPRAGDRFGYSVAAWNDLIAVGCYRESSQADNSGAVYLYNAISGQLVRTIFNPTPGGGDLFAKSMAVVGDKLLVGAPEDDAGAQNSGAAYLFDLQTGNLLHTMLNPTPSVDDEYARAVAAIGNDFLIGAPFDDHFDVDVGVAYLYDGDSGQLLRTIHNPEPTHSDWFGASLGAMEDEIIVGAYLDDTGAADTGALYFFQGPARPSNYPGDANGDGLVTGADYTIWADNYGGFLGEALYSEGDFNGDGMVSGADYTIWADHYGDDPSNRIVPEASSVALASMACAAGLLIAVRGSVGRAGL